MRPAALIAPPGSTPPEASLSDPQTAAVLVAIVESEIVQAHIAEGKAASDGVADLATAIYARRSATERDLAGFMWMLPPGTQHSGMLVRVEKDADRVTSGLAGQTGVHFDVAYIAGQIHAFERDIAVIDTRLVPDAQAHELVRIAKKLRADLVEDLAAARTLRGKFVRKAGRPIASEVGPCPPRRERLPSEPPCS